MGEKESYDPGNRKERLGLIERNPRKKNHDTKEVSVSASEEGEEIEKVREEDQKIKNNKTGKRDARQSGTHKTSAKSRVVNMEGSVQVQGAFQRSKLGSCLRRW